MRRGRVLWQVVAGAFVVWMGLSYLPAGRVGAAMAPARMARPAVTMLDAIDFVDPQHGWAGGAGILATADGGHTWMLQSSPSATISALDFVNAQDGWALGQTAAYKPLVLRTTDGGRHWLPAREPAISLGGRRVLQQVRFVSPTSGIGIAGPNDSGGMGGRLVATSDGGETWTAIGTPAPVTSACFVPLAGGMSGGNATTGWAVAVQGDAVWRTTDGGRSWTRTFTAGPSFTYGGQVACISASNAWALLDGATGMSQHSYALYHTSDGGAHWRVVVAVSTAGAGPAPGTTRSIPGPGIYVAHLAAVNGATAFLAGGCPACGAMGTTAVGYTTDGGSTWRNEPIIPGIGYSANLAVSFLTAQRGWLATTNYLNASADRRVGVILATADGGRTWARE